MYCMYRGNISETCVGSDLAYYLNKMVTFTVKLIFTVPIGSNDQLAP